MAPPTPGSITTTISGDGIITSVVDARVHDADTCLSGALVYGHSDTTNKDDKTTAPATTHTDLAAVPPWRRGAQQIADAVEEGTRGTFKGDSNDLSESSIRAARGPGAPQPITKLLYVPNAMMDKDPLLACTLALKTGPAPDAAVLPAPTSIVGLSGGSSFVPPPPLPPVPAALPPSRRPCNPTTAAATPSASTEIKLTSIVAGHFTKTKFGLGATVREEAQLSKSEWTLGSVVSPTGNLRNRPAKRPHWRRIY